MHPSVHHRILMLETDPDDRFITSTVFGEQQYPVDLVFAEDKAEVFAHLDHCRQHQLPYPSLILVTLTTSPTGRETLQQLKSHAAYKHIPVVILTGNSHETIARECYALGATSVIEKPSGTKETYDKISNFFRYWFGTVEL